jgi:hypothetical protein
MKAAIALVLLWGLVVSLCAHADSARITRPVWVIVLTITDKTTGKRVKEHEIGSELRFDDRAQCESIVAKAGPLPDSHFFVTVMTCRELTRI